MSSTAELLHRVRQADADQQAQATADYDAATDRAARGGPLDPNDVLSVAEAAGRTIDEFATDVERKAALARMEALAATEPKVSAEFDAAERELDDAKAAAAKAIKAAEEQVARVKAAHEVKVAAAGDVRDKARSRLVEVREARRELAAQADPATTDDVRALDRAINKAWAAMNQANTAAGAARDAAREARFLIYPNPVNTFQREQSAEALRVAEHNEAERKTHQEQATRAEAEIARLRAERIEVSRRIPRL